MPWIKHIIIALLIAAFALIIFASCSIQSGETTHPATATVISVTAAHQSSSGFSYSIVYETETEGRFVEIVSSYRYRMDPLVEGDTVTIETAIIGGERYGHYYN